MNSHWFVQALGGAIGLLFFLAVVPGVVESTIGGASEGISQGSIQTLAGDINRVCSGDEDSISRRIELREDITLEISGDTMEVENTPPDSELEDIELECEIESETSIEQTKPYQVVNVENGGFRLS
jgi:hypothetical protein